MYFEEAE